MKDSDVLPLIFEFVEDVFADRYAIRIRVKGKAVVVTEDDGEVSLHSLVPSGSSGGGETLVGAYRSFRANFRETLSDLAEQERTAAHFEAAFRDYFTVVPDHMDKLWRAAVERVKSGSAGKADLPEQAHYSERTVEFQELALSSTSNDANAELAIAA